MADNRYRFAVPGENSGNENMVSNSASREGEAKLPDFSKMTKQEIKEFDAIHGSYKRLLGDKPITFFWLMNHYSKANAEAYNRQKNARITQSSEDKSEKRIKQDTEEKSDSGKKMIADSEYRSDNDDLSRLRYGKESPSGTEEDYHRGCVKRDDYPEDDYERTVFIDPTRRGSVKKKSGARIVCVGFDQTVEIRRTPFVIGRSTKNVDLCIMDNTAISSRHAQIIEKNGEYYIVDMGSLNHVYINNSRIPENIEVALKNNTTFRLADEEFIFKNE